MCLRPATNPMPPLGSTYTFWRHVLRTDVLGRSPVVELVRFSSSLSVPGGTLGSTSQTSVSLETGLGRHSAARVLGAPRTPVEPYRRPTACGKDDGKSFPRPGAEDLLDCARRPRFGRNRMQAINQQKKGGRGERTDENTIIKKKKNADPACRRRVESAARERNLDGGEIAGRVRPCPTLHVLKRHRGVRYDRSTRG